MKKSFIIILSLFSFMVAGCAAVGEDYKANVWDASQVNTQQAAKVVKILTVSAAKIKVDNTENKEIAQGVGTLLGALTGAAVDNHANAQNRTVGAVAGGVVGYGAGSLVSDTKLVDGVLLSYQIDGQIFTSAQVGRLCDFVAGQNSILVSMKTGETRIQPNGTCPEKQN